MAPKLPIFYGEFRIKDFLQAQALFYGYEQVTTLNSEMSILDRQSFTNPSQGQKLSLNHLYMGSNYLLIKTKKNPPIQMLSSKTHSYDCKRVQTGTVLFVPDPDPYNETWTQTQRVYILWT